MIEWTYKFMKLLKEKNRQQVVGMLAVCIFIFTFLLCFVNFLIYKDYCKQVNPAMAEILLKVREHYPKVEQGELIHILNQKEQGDKFYLSDFGIGIDDINIIRSMENCFYHGLLLSNFVLLCFGILAIVIFFLYFWQENKKIGEIIDYIHAIHRKNYTLCLLENEEGAISFLKNELYKITVMLREQADKSRKEQEAVKESMADISHQIKTPMTSVLIMLENLREDEEMPKNLQRKFLTEMNQQLQWINSLVVSMLKLSRLDANVIKFKEEKIYLYEFFQEIRKGLLILMEARLVTVVIEKKQEVYFWGDCYWEREAMTNLLKNAIEHTAVGTKVQISFEQNYFYTKVFIRDQGKGIEPEEQRRIFERFYRGEHTKEGVGIGLSLAKKIIEYDHGRIKAKSQRGEGTIFEITYSNR